MHLDPKTFPARTAHGVDAINVASPYLSWGAVMQHHETAYGEKPWMIYRNGGDSRAVWSYAVFIDTARRMASLLAAQGVNRGDRVVIAGHNHPDTILSYFACWLIGACAVPLNMTEDDNRLSYIIGNCGAELILCRSTYLDRLKTAVTIPDGVEVLDVDTDSSEDSRFYDEVRAQVPYPYPEPNEDMRWDECLIVYTSGTTGNPKGVVLIQQNLFADGFDIAKWHGITEDRRMMCVLPVHHVNGTIVTHVAPFLAGSSVVLNRKFSATGFFSAIKEEDVHVVSVVPYAPGHASGAQCRCSGRCGTGLRPHHLWRRTAHLRTRRPV